MADSIWQYLISGTVFGLSAGFSPGPLTALVISETLKHNAAEGAKIAMAPLITDLPIIVAGVWAVSLAAGASWALGLIALAGGGYLARLGWESLRFRGVSGETETVPPRSFRRGVIANLLNPNPYLFWGTVGGPLLAQGLTHSPAAAGLFLVPFYGLLVGVKVGIAVVVGRSRRFLKSRGYVWINRGLGMVLWVFAALFLWEGALRLMGE
ncbi:MAG: LysE family translocator [Desulfococcaceae bacterium]